MASNSQPTQRLFFALWPDDALRGQLAKLNRQLPVATGKPVAPENLHITLQFLGSVTDAQYQQLLHATPVYQAPAFTLQLDRLGYFPKAQVLWLGARETPPALQQIVHSLGGLMTDCGLKPDTRPYHAHLTLRRKVKKPLLDFQFDSFTWPVTSIVLARSDTRAEGVKYDILHQWPLQTTA